MSVRSSAQRSRASAAAMRCARVVSLAVPMAVSGCDGSTEPDVGEPAHLVVVAGDAQRGPPDQVLPLPIVLQVTDAGGTPLRSVPVTFEPSTSTDKVGAVTYNANTNTVSTTWLLSAGSHAEHELAARVTDAPSVSVTLTAVEDFDVLLIPGMPQSSVGVIVSGETPFGRLSYHGVVGLGSALNVPPFGPGAAEVAVFPREGPPVLLTPDWTAGRDTLTVTVAPPVEIPIAVWIVAGSYADQQQLALSHAAVTRDVWQQEGVGIDFGDIVVIDATTHPLAAQYVDFPTATAFCDGAIVDSIGQVADRLNVYYVGDIGTYAGYACNTGLSATRASYIGASRQSPQYPGLLAHELGHSLGLFHPPESWSVTNLMHAGGGGPPPYYLTEGQIFRMHYTVFSSLNRLFHVHPENLLRNCFQDACMPEETHLWPDGP
jgi:hypothetical protein